jgi:hypothetical protein
MEASLFKTFWGDPEIEAQPHDIKLAALWAFSNPRVRICGYSETTPKRFELETDLPYEALGRALKGFPRMLIPLGRGIWVRNYIKHNAGGRGASLAKSYIAIAIVKDLEVLAILELDTLLYAEYPSILKVKQKLWERAAKGASMPPETRVLEATKSIICESSLSGGLDFNIVIDGRLQFLHCSSLGRICDA